MLIGELTGIYNKRIIVGYVTQSQLQVHASKIEKVVKVLGSLVNQIKTYKMLCTITPFSQIDVQDASLKSAKPNYK